MRPPRKNSPPRTVGRYFEQIAARRLKQQGYRICGRNLQYGRWEIDLLALDGNMLVFVEVKSRKDISIFLPEQALTGEKRSSLTRAALACLRDMEHRGVETAQFGLRFDTISITFDDSYAVTEFVQQKEFLEPNDESLFRSAL